MGNSRDLIFPARLCNGAGAPRRVGIELEINGLSVDRAAQLVAQFLGGSVHSRGRYERIIDGDPEGDWRVELDARALRQLGREPRDGPLGGLEQSAEDLLVRVAGAVVPVELVSPPLPFERLAGVETLFKCLRREGALGTSDRVTNAFGLHLNPEVPSLEPAVIAGVLKAFVCLYEWLRQRVAADLARHLTTYIEPYPAAYVQRLVAPDYQPGHEQLMADYLYFNATRNRALDLLPLLAHLDAERVRAAVDDPRIKPRPAFHYRLPDSDIHDPVWGLYRAWNDWVMVERLAESEAMLADCCADYRRHLERPLQRWFGDWCERLEQTWLPRL